MKIGDFAARKAEGVPISMVSCYDAWSAALVAEAGHELVNVDSTLIAEAPKILPHREAMRGRIAGALGLPAARVNIKATTNETMGFVGRQEGIAAIAIAEVR